MKDEYFREHGIKYQNRAEIERTISELHAEHGVLNVEWADVHGQTMEAYEALKAVLAGPLSAEMSKETAAIDVKLQSLRDRQREIIDRQGEIEQQLSRLIR